MVRGPAPPPEAFAAWVTPHLATMARLAARLAPDAERDDIVQEALSRAWLKRDQYDEGRGSPRTWLLAITADQARKAGARRRPRLVLVERPDPSANLDERVDVERALLRLTRRQRFAVDCVYFVDLSVRETAALMRCSEGTVKSTLADARRRLRDLLEEQ